MKDMLGLRDTSREEIESILETAKAMKQVVTSENKRTPHLQGKSIITLFYENSTRTRMSFELASKYMGSASANVSASASSVAKGETLIDTGVTLDMMGVDLIIIRHPNAGAPHLLAKHVQAGVINAGDGMNEHPTQALLDMYTIMENKGRLDGLKVGIVGDVAHSRVARSNAIGMSKLGAEVRLFAPGTLMPPGMDKLGATVCTSMRDCLDGADVVMGLRIQRERMKAGLIPSVREYSKLYGIGLDELRYAKPDALLMHPGPMNRGVEISTYAAECGQSVIAGQVQNGVAVRMALLYKLCRKEQA